MMVFMKGAFQIICLSAVALAIPLSLLEDVKEMRLKAPARSNKVKRAQEVIMFGNQQNRGSEARGFTFPRTEKRAADVDDNALSDVATLPNILPQVEENGYDTNQLDAARMADLDRAYLYGGEPVFNIQLRNALKGQMYSEPAYNDLSLYNIVDARRKREAKILQRELRNKRELEFNPDDLFYLPKLWEAERKLHESRAGWPWYGANNEDYDFGESPEENDVESPEEYMQNPKAGYWLDGPASKHHTFPNGEAMWPRQHKRFMVSKRRMGDDSLLQLMSGKQDGHVPVYRRYFL